MKQTREGFLYWISGKLYELLDWWEHRKDGK